MTNEIITQEQINIKIKTLATLSRAHRLKLWHKMALTDNLDLNNAMLDDLAVWSIENNIDIDTP